MATFSHTLPVDAPAPRLWALVRDVQRVAGLFPYTSVEEMQSPAADCWRFWRQLAIPNIAALRWREEARVLDNRTLDFHVLEGDLQTYAGQWAVVADGVTSTLLLTLEYEIPEGVAPQLPPLLAGYVMGEIFKTICQRIKDAAEESV